MFTGLIQTCGLLEQARRVGDGLAIRITCPEPFNPPLVRGESVAVQGICLTVTRADERGFEADLLDETWARGAWRHLVPGARLNLERALRLGDRMGGHWVTGHVDETGTITSIEPTGRDWRLRIRCSFALARLIVPKGSIAIDGISLTVVQADAQTFETQIIPTTWHETSLHERHPGDTVNLEADLIAKHVQRLLQAPDPENALSAENLAAAGFGQP